MLCVCVLFDFFFFEKSKNLSPPPEDRRDAREIIFPLTHTHKRINAA